MKEFNEFDAYINNELNESEKKSFEQRLQDDKEFNDAFESHLNLVLGLETYHLKNILKEHKLPSNNKNPKKYGKYVVSGIVLAIIVAIIGILIFKKPPQKPAKPKIESDSKKIFALYYETDPGLPSKMGFSKQIIFDKGMIQYKIKNYDQALEYWNTLENQNNDTLIYYKAMIDINTGNYSKSYSDLQKLDEKSEFYPKAQWYKLLILLKEKKEQEAKALSKELISSKNNYRLEDIKEIYRMLSKTRE